VKTVLRAGLLLTVGVLAAGCGASSSSAAAPGSSAAAPASSGATASTTAPATAGPTASGSASTGSASTGTAAGLAACRSADLQASLGGGAGAGMSQNHTGLQLRNIGSTTCTLYGYPGVSWVAGADGHQVGAAATRQADITGGAEKVVTLAPGAVASAPLDIVDAAVIPKSECKPVPVRGLRVYPPGERAALFIASSASAGQYGECSAVTGPATLVVGYLQPGVQPGS
jgi:hypothetical protein